MGNLLLRHVEVETGRVLDFVDFIVDPLDYDDLLSVLPNQSVSIPVKLRDAKVIDEQGVTAYEGRASTTFKLDSPYTSNVIALIDGGWLPVIWTTNDKVVLVDRNVISEIQARFHGGEKLDGINDDFLDLLAKRPVRINPLLYAMEGNQKRQPSNSEVEEQILEAVRKIQQALPSAVIEPEGLSGLHGVIGLIRDGATGLQRKSQFLRTVAPRLMAATSKKRRTNICMWIVAEADKAGVPRKSLTVLAALSCVACPQGVNPARRVLKPSADYDEKQAYNALFDLRALELFIASQALFPERPVTFFTRDRQLALFWVGLGVHNIRLEKQHHTFNVRFEKLFPDLKVDELTSILGEV